MRYREYTNSLKKVVLDLCEEIIPEEQLFVEHEKDSMEEKVRQCVLNILFSIKFTGSQIQKALSRLEGSTMLGQETHPEKPTQEKHAIPFSGLVAHLVVSFISQTLRQFPIIEQTSLLKHVVAFNQPPGFALQNGMLYLKKQAEKYG